MVADESSEPADTFETAFNPRRNSLNLLRLVLAVSVVASHAIGLGLFGRDWIGNRTTIGEVAVFGFFGISGFLIARSAENNSFGRYLWQRFVRIFPAFWICLIITAFGLAFFNWLHLNEIAHLHTPASAYLDAPNGPVGYVTHNWFLKINQQTIITTVWNASIWTLFYEFLCYLLLAGLALTGILRHRLAVLFVFVALWIAEALCVIVPKWQRISGETGANHSKYFVELTAVFLAGTLLYLYRDRIRDSGWIALGCVSVLTISLWLPLGGTVPGLTLTSTALLAPVIAYPVLWLGFHLPFTQVGAKNDYSYGIYIYAYPVGVLLGPFGAANHGYPVFFALNLLFTIPLAVASWWLVERQALKLKRWTPGRRRLSDPTPPIVGESAPATSDLGGDGVTVPPEPG